MTAKDYILERLKTLKGLDSPAPTRGLDLFERVTIAELEKILSLLKTDRTALAKRLKKFHADHQPESEQTWAECETELRAIINELESKSEMR